MYRIKSFDIERYILRARTQKIFINSKYEFHTGVGKKKTSPTKFQSDEFRIFTLFLAVALLNHAKRCDKPPEYCRNKKNYLVFKLYTIIMRRHVLYSHRISRISEVGFNVASTESGTELI